MTTHQIKKWRYLNDDSFAEACNDLISDTVLNRSWEANFRFVSQTNFLKHKNLGVSLELNF